MKKAVSIFVTLVVSVAMAIPEIASNSVSLTQGDNADVVKITYTLTGEPGIVTIDLQTNALADASGAWTSIGGEAMGELRCEANKYVRVLNEPVSAYWFPSKTFSDTIAAGGLRAVIKAWPTNCPPDYMVVNLTAPTNTIRFYESTVQFPGGFTNVIYKTEKLVMRKVPAAGVVWRMGAPDGETGKDASADVVHKVMLTEDYFAGIYEVTQSQYYNMCGSYHNCIYRNFADSPIRAFQGLQYSYLRGQNKDAKAGYWPENGHAVTEDSVIGKLRAKCGIADIDLPTEAQWEYACRAGTGTALPSGKDLTTDNLKEIGVREYNVVTSAMAVGMKQPNAWGLYDTIGNVWEGCLDRFISGDSYKSMFTVGWETGAVTTNQTGTTNKDVVQCVFRGGCWSESLNYCRSGSRVGQGIEYYSPTVGYKGFRLFCSVHAVADWCAR